MKWDEEEDDQEEEEEGEDEEEVGDDRSLWSRGSICVCFGPTVHESVLPASLSLTLAIPLPLP